MAHILFVIESAPYVKGLTDEIHDLIMASTAYGHSASALFTGNGVNQLVSEQNPPQNQKHASKRIKGFEFFDVEPVYANQSALFQQSIATDTLISDIVLVDDEKQRQLIDNADFTIYL